MNFSEKFKKKEIAKNPNKYTAWLKIIIKNKKILSNKIL